MKNIYNKMCLGCLGLFINVGLYAQIGINTIDPKVSLHVLPKSTGAATAEGIIAPNLTLSQVILKDAKYGVDQTGAIIYVTDINATTSFKTAKVTSVGYYYFDGALWQPFSGPIPDEPWFVQGTSTQANNNASNIYQSADVAIGASSSGGKRLHVEGTANITGATTLGSSLAVTGPTTIASTGSFTLAGNGVGAGKYLMSDGTGKGTWTVAPAEPWQVQGVTPAKQATLNTENIYQMGNVAVGIANPSTEYKFFVQGNSGFVGNVIVSANNDARVGLGVGTPTAKLDVRGNQFTSGVAKIGGNTTLNTSAQLELADNNKAFLPNRVNLVALNNPSPIATADKADGMFVFNLKTDLPAGLIPGYYYWYQNLWNRLEVALPQNRVNVVNLTVAVDKPYEISVSSSLPATSGQILPFEDIIIPETGYYAFSYRLYGYVMSGGTLRRGVYYIALMGQTGTAVPIVKDQSVMIIMVSPQIDYSYSITLAGQFNKGEKVVTKMSKEDINWRLKGGNTGPVRTSMIWWKI